jgi:hypothetical protein
MYVILILPGAVVSVGVLRSINATANFRAIRVAFRRRLASRTTPVHKNWVLRTIHRDHTSRSPRSHPSFGRGRD